MRDPAGAGAERTERVALTVKVMRQKYFGAKPELAASGNAIELQGSAFLTLEDDKIVEVWTVFDALALAVQTGAAEAPAWWPGRSSP